MQNLCFIHGGMLRKNLSLLYKWLEVGHMIDISYVVQLMLFPLCEGVPAQVGPVAVLACYPVHHVPDLVCNDQ